MKIRILILSIICISVGSKFYSCISKPERSSKFEAIFIADSGFIDKYSLVYLFPNIDTADFKYYNFDKAGKYYKDYRSAKYIVLIYNPNKEEYTSTQLISVDILKEQITEGARFTTRWYSPKEQIQSFNKVGEYYSLDDCVGHGSAYSAMGFYLFQDINNVGKAIFRSIYCGGLDGEFQSLSIQDLSIHHDTLKIDYLLESGIYKKINTIDTFRILSTEKLPVDYIRKRKEWTAIDSTLFIKNKVLFIELYQIYFYRLKSNISLATSPVMFLHSPSFHPR